MGAAYENAGMKKSSGSQCTGLELSADRSTVTVVIVTYNHARFLGDAIESVLAQSIPATEVIVVDDGSTDDPKEIVGRYSAVKLIRQANQGLSAARNTGLNAAQGEFIVFLDADDRLTPVMIETNLRQIGEQPDCALVYGAYVLVDGAGSPFRYMPVNLPTADAYAGFLRGNLIGMIGTVMFRRDVVAADGGFDVSLSAAEDYDLYLRLARKYPFAATHIHLAEYRKHGNNMSDDLPLMLDMVLKVQRRHERIAAERTEWKGAYEEGRQAWQDFYVRRQIAQILRSRPSNMLPTLRRAAHFSHIAPASTLRELRRLFVHWKRGQTSAR